MRGAKQPSRAQLPRKLDVIMSMAWLYALTASFRS